MDLPLPDLEECFKFMVKNNVLQATATTDVYKVVNHMTRKSPQARAAKMATRDTIAEQMLDFVVQRTKHDPSMVSMSLRVKVLNH